MTAISLQNYYLVHLFVYNCLQKDPIKISHFAVKAGYHYDSPVAPFDLQPQNREKFVLKII